MRSNVPRIDATGAPENDPELTANDGKPFHNLAQGTFMEHEIVVAGEGRRISFR